MWGVTVLFRLLSNTWPQVILACLPVFIHAIDSINSHLCVFFKVVLLHIYTSRVVADFPEYL